MFPIDSSVNILKGKQSRVTKGSYFLSLPDGLADILCSIISFGMLCGRSSSPLRFFSNFACCSFRCNTIFLFFLSSWSCNIFPLHDFCLRRVVAWFLLDFKFLLISFSLTCCQTNKKMETIEKIIHALLYGEKLFYSSFDAKDANIVLLHRSHHILFHIIQNSVNESRRLCHNCIWPQWTMCCMQSWT